MANLSFEEHCPCGAKIKIAGYASEIKLQISSWHTKHARHPLLHLKALIKMLETTAYPLLPMPMPTEESSAAIPKSDDFDIVSVNMTEGILGMAMGENLLRTHGKSQCAGPPSSNGKPICCIHNPTDHHMRTWKQNWRADRGIMERICPGEGHGIGHPDPDDLAILTDRDAGVHGCDGCCQPPGITATL